MHACMRDSSSMRQQLEAVSITTHIVCYECTQQYALLGNSDSQGKRRFLRRRFLSSSRNFCGAKEKPLGTGEPAWGARPGPVRFKLHSMALEEWVNTSQVQWLPRRFEQLAQLQVQHLAETKNLSVNKTGACKFSTRMFCPPNTFLFRVLSLTYSNSHTSH